MALPGSLRRLPRAVAVRRRPSSLRTRLRRCHGPFDPELVRLRSSLLPYRRRLWMRRLVRRGWIVLAAVMVAEVLLWTVARFVPLERAVMLGAAIPLVGLLGWLVAGVRARPRVGETALAVDAEGALGDRVSSALELAVAFPGSAGPAAARSGPGRDRAGRRGRRDRQIRPPATARCPPLDRHDAGRPVQTALLAPTGHGRAAGGPPAGARHAAPEPAGRRDRAATTGPRGSRTTSREDRSGRRRPADKGGDAQDPRTRLAQELRDLARQLRERPDDLDANLARLGAIETEVRAQVDPSNEQRAASLTALSRALSSAATGKPEANPAGDPAEGARRPQGPRRQARRADARATARAGPPVGRPRGDGITGGRSRRNGIERRRPEPGAGRHGWGSPGAGSAG